MKRFYFMPKILVLDIHPTKTTDFFRIGLTKFYDFHYCKTPHPNGRGFYLHLGWIYFIWSAEGGLGNECDK